VEKKNPGNIQPVIRLNRVRAPEKVCSFAAEIEGTQQILLYRDDYTRRRRFLKVIHRAPEHGKNVSPKFLCTRG